MMAYDRRLLWVVAILLLTAVGIRLVHLDQSLLSFHPTRQFRSAIIARSCYYDRTPSVPEWARRVARANVSMQPAGEPIIMEGLACAAYRILGREALAVPRVLAVVFWLLGAIPLFGLARRVASGDAALVGLATYLFMPYGIVASRAFQPDPLMTSCALWAVWSVARYMERGTTSRLWLAAAAVAIAAIVKPMSVFLTVPAAAGLAMGHGGVRALSRRGTWLPVVLGLAPPVAYYGYSAVFGTLARDQMNLRFVPALLPTAFFWGGLWRMIERVWTAPIFVASVAGTILATRVGRWLLTALWVGYLLFAIAFTYHMPTHDYYHLPYIAVAALSLSALLARLPATVAVVVAIVIAVWGSVTAWPRLAEGDRAVVARYEQIGALAEHHSRVLFLDTEYGYPLMYHGQVSGDSWPSSDDLAAEALGGEPPLDARDRYARDYADYGASYFIVTDLRSLREQPDLQAFLAQNARVVRQTPHFHLYRFN
jgi:hypothetical protein